MCSIGWKKNEWFELEEEKGCFVDVVTGRSVFLLFFYTRVTSSDAALAIATAHSVQEPCVRIYALIKKLYKKKNDERIKKSGIQPQRQKTQSGSLYVFNMKVLNRASPGRFGVVDFKFSTLAAPRWRTFAFPPSSPFSSREEPLRIGVVGRRSVTAIPPPPPCSRFVLFFFLPFFIASVSSFRDRSYFSLRWKNFRLQFTPSILKLFGVAQHHKKIYKNRGHFFCALMCHCDGQKVRSSSALQLFCLFFVRVAGSKIAWEIVRALGAALLFIAPALIYLRRRFFCSGAQLIIRRVQRVKAPVFAPKRRASL